MSTYIYILGCMLYNLTHTNKIGSSNNPMNRRNTLQTGFPVELKILRIYKIKNEDVDAYDIDEFLKTINEYQKYLGDIQIQHYESTGGKEHYIIPNLDDLSKLFDKIGIQYEIINDYSIFDNKDKHKELLGNNTIVKQLGEKLKNIPQEIKLRDYQQLCIDAFVKLLKLLEYFQGIFYLATGTGKTIIAIYMCLAHLKLYPNENILWITFRNDIVDGQYDQFKKYSDIFVLCNHGNFDVKLLKNSKGKIFVVLRQSLLNKTLPINTIHGVIYDECHDASKISQKIEDTIDGKTYDFLKSLKDTQKLKYRIGMSATPLTESNRQNIGSLELYGKDKQINYLYKYSLLDAIKDGWLLKPSFAYIKLNSQKYNLDDLYQIFAKNDYKKYTKYYQATINKIIKEIKKVIDNSNHIYKKGIIWFPYVNMVEFFYEELKKDWYDNIKLSYSTCDHDTDDKEFRKSDSNFIMLACEKFTVGFDAVNLEFGCNITYGESGYVIVQKIGRFTRKKPNQEYAYFYQFCENNDDEEKSLFKNMIKICENIGAKDIKNNICIQGKNKESNKTNHKPTDYFIFNISYVKMDFEMFKSKLVTMIRDKIEKTIVFKINNGDISYNDIKKIVAKYNLTSKKNYMLLCETVPELPRDPQGIFKHDFINWVDYLSISRDKYYDFKICRKKIIKYRNHLHKFYEIHQLALFVCPHDKKFPEPDIWGDFYGVENGSLLLNLFNNI